MASIWKPFQKISKLSWRAIEQDYSLDKYEEELEKIARQERNYTPMSWQSVPGLPVEGSVSCLVVTGLLF